VQAAFEQLGDLQRHLCVALAVLTVGEFSASAASAFLESFASGGDGKVVDAGGGGLLATDADPPAAVLSLLVQRTMLQEVTAEGVSEERKRFRMHDNVRQAVLAAAEGKAALEEPAALAGVFVAHFGGQLAELSKLYNQKDQVNAFSLLFLGCFFSLCMVTYACVVSFWFTMCSLS
jgi:hypothetical protein